MIDFDGSKELTYDFPREFQVRQGGKTYPFYKLANNKIRFMDEVPAAGGLDIVEVVSKQQQAKPLLCHSIADLAFLTKDDVNKIDYTASRLKDQSAQIEQTIKVTQDLLSETQKYEDANKSEIDALKNDTAQGLVGLAQGLSDANAKIEAVRNESLVNSSELSAGLSAHETAYNPHKINRKMLGLDKVDNTPDKDKPISNAMQEALDSKADKDAITEIEDKIEKTKKKQEEMINGLASFGAAYSDPLPSISGKKGKYLKTDGKKTYWAEVSGGGGSSDYADLENKPQINNVTLVGNKSASDLGLQSKIDADNKLSADFVSDTDSTNKFVTASEKTTWNGKQDALVSGENIKTINNASILGDGNIDVDGLPSQTGQNGKFLTTNGINASWVSVAVQQPNYNNGTLEF